MRQVECVVSEQISAEVLFVFCHMLKGLMKEGLWVTEERLREKLSNYQKAMKRLEESIALQNPNEYIYDAVIKRFEFTYELAWKLMKAYIEYKGGEEVRFARDVFREAYANGLIRDGEVWLQMMKDRNLSSHTYDEEAAREIYERVKQSYWKHFFELSLRIGKDLANENGFE